MLGRILSTKNYDNISKEIFIKEYLKSQKNYSVCGTIELQFTVVLALAL